MNTFQTLFILAAFAISTTASFAQNTTSSLLFNLQQIDGQTWGVFVQPDNSIDPTGSTTAGSGQVTIVAPIDFDYADLKNAGGTWVENARVDGPAEAPGMAYISFGFVTDSPKIELFPTEGTLLFSFTVDATFNGSFSLFENGVDVFSVPNSFNSNPGNDLGIIDYGVQGGVKFYTYAGNMDGDQPAKAILASNNE